MKIRIQTIPHARQRYNTIGDWQTNKVTGEFAIYVSELGSWKYEFLVAVHELVESFLCLHDGVAEEDVTKFDKQYVGAGEPGDDPSAPYKRQHCIATGVERILAAWLGVDWEIYEEHLGKLFEARERREDGKNESLSEA